jgi:large subunit ribosomal protein L18
MYNRLVKREQTRLRRKMRVRNGLKGKTLKPRLSVSKTNRHLYVQIIDDITGKTLFGVGTMSKEFRAGPFAKKSKAAAREIGLYIGRAAQEKEIKAIVFDRGRFRFHGLVAEIAAGAREAGLQF